MASHDIHKDSVDVNEKENNGLYAVSVLLYNAAHYIEREKKKPDRIEFWYKKNKIGCRIYFPKGENACSKS